MLGDLPQDIMGTSPKYPPIINHDWLKVNTETYDNFPSDNNPVRVLPKLSEMWNHGADVGISIVPNLTAQPLGIRSADLDITKEIVKEAKKAMMSGLTEKDLADHLRARYASKYLIAAKEELGKLAEEQGLLGNVYIDVSAFTSANEAEQFLTHHRGRLAQDILVNESKINKDAIQVLANKFHKNVVSKINYDEKLFQKYKTHLTASKKIASDFIIDSKEALRQAFLPKPSTPTIPAAPKQETALPEEQAVKELTARSENNLNFERSAADEIDFRSAKPIIQYACEQASKGKIGNDLKDMLRGKYASEDLNKVAKYLIFVATGMKSEMRDSAVSSGKISEYTGEELKKLAKKYPVKASEYAPIERSPKQAGIPGFFYAMTGKSSSNKYAEEKSAALNCLRSGIPMEKVFTKLREKLSAEDSNLIMTEAVNSINNSSIGLKANVFKPAPKIKVVADLEEKQTLPDPSTIPSQSQEILSFFEGCEMEVDTGSPVKIKKAEITELFNRSGIDSVM